MDNISIINDSNSIIDPDVYDLDVIDFIISKHIRYIRQKAPVELMKSISNEMRCVYHEIRLGDGNGDDIETVYNDTIDALKPIIPFL